MSGVASRLLRSVLLGAAWATAAAASPAASTLSTPERAPELAAEPAAELAAVAACGDHEAEAPLLEPVLADACEALRSAVAAVNAADPAAASRHFDRAQGVLDRLAEGIGPGVAMPASWLRMRAQLLVGRAWTERLARQLDSAEVHLDRAAALLDRIGLRISSEASTIENARTLLAFARQDLPAVIVHARAELAMGQALGLGDSPDQLHAYATLGAVLSMLQRFDESEAELRAALDIMDRHPDANPSAQLGILNNLAAGATNRGRYAQAVEPATRAVELARRAWGPDTPRQVTARLNRASALRWTGRLGAARDDIEAATRIEQRDPARLTVHQRLNLHTTAAALHRSVGDRAAAREAVERGISLIGADAGLSYWRGRLLAHRAMLNAREGRHAESARDLAEASALLGAVVGRDENLVRWAQAELCVQQSIARLPTSGCDRLREWLPSLDEQMPYNRYVVHAALAVEAQRRDDSTTEREQLLAALAAAQRHASPPQLWAAPLELARHLWRHGQRALAIAFGKQAIEGIEALRADLNPSSVQPFLIDKAEVYREVADWLAEEGRIDEMLAILRLLKDQEFHDFTLRDAGLSAGGAGGAALGSREQAALQRWRDAVASAAPGPSVAPGSASPPAGTPSEIEWARRAGKALIEALAKDAADSSPGERLGEASRPPGPPAAGRPSAGELHVHALAAESHLTLVLVAARSRTVVRVPWDRREASRQVGLALAAVGDPGRRDDVRVELQQLNRLLASPIFEAAEAADARRLVLHLDGALRYLPMAALHDGRRSLGDRYAIEHRLEPRARPADPGAAATAAPATKSTLEVRALGVSRPLAGQRGLPGVAREVCTIVDGPIHGLADDDAAVFAPLPGESLSAPCARPRTRDGDSPQTGSSAPGRTAAAEPPARGNGVLTGEAWLNDHFTTDRLKRVLAERPGSQRRSVLHVGSHFTLRPGDMQRSWLLLGDGARLQLRDMAALQFDGHDLVALSACETGVGGTETGDGSEVEGFARLVARRGAGAVLATLWRVDDASTSRLMRAFYRELLRTDSAEALRRAQAEVRDAPGGQWAAPFHWAGFVLLRR